MSMISELVADLKEYEQTAKEYNFTGYADVLRQAADTIESLSAKVAEANTERSENWHKLHKIIGELEWAADDANDRTLTDVTDDMFYYDGKEDGIRLAIESIRSLSNEDTANVTEKAKAD